MSANVNECKSLLPGRFHSLSPARFKDMYNILKRTLTIWKVNYTASGQQEAHNQQSFVLNGCMGYLYFWLLCDQVGLLDGITRTIGRACLSVTPFLPPSLPPTLPSPKLVQRHCPL